MLMKIIPSQPFMFMPNEQTGELIEKRNTTKALVSDQTANLGESPSNAGLRDEEDGDCTHRPRQRRCQF
jgi:hypothetical protein